MSGQPVTNRKVNDGTNVSAAQAKALVAGEMVMEPEGINLLPLLYDPQGNGRSRPERITYDLGGFIR